MLRVPGSVLSRRVEDDALVLDLESGRTYVLNETAAVTWSLLADGASLDAVAAALVDQFDADADQVRADVDEIVDDLVDRGLLLRDDA